MEDQANITRNLKRKLCQAFEPLSKQRNAKVAPFENLLFEFQFTHLGEAIFDNLDDQSIAKCLEVNETLQHFIYEQNSYWIRKIKHFIGTSNVFRKDWEKILKGPNIQTAKIMAIAIPCYIPKDLFDFHPHFIAIRMNSVTFLKQVLNHPYVTIITNAGSSILLVYSVIGKQLFFTKKARTESN